MTLFVSPASGGSPIVNVSGTNMDFSIDITDGTANITALGYSVEVILDSDIANVRWYQFPVTGTLEYYTAWTSIFGLRVTGASVRSTGNYNGATHLYFPTGTGLGNDAYMSSNPSLRSWYPNAYYFIVGGYYKYFMGYTFHCPMTGNYSIFAEQMRLGQIPAIDYYTIEYEATVTIFVAGQSSTPSTDSYSGPISSVMTEHDGLSVTDVPLISGTQYSFEFTVDINVTSLSGDPGSSPYWTLYLVDPYDPPLLWYRITGTSG